MGFEQRVKLPIVSLHNALLVIRSNMPIATTERESIITATRLFKDALLRLGQTSLVNTGQGGQATAIN